MPPRDLPDDGKSEAKSPRAPIAAVVQAGEWLEHALALASRDATTVIVDVDRRSPAFAL